MNILKYIVPTITVIACCILGGIVFTLLVDVLDTRIYTCSSFVSDGLLEAIAMLIVSVIAGLLLVLIDMSERGENG